MMNILENTEKAMLGCLMRAPKIYTEVGLFLKPEHFSSLKTKRLYEIYQDWIKTQTNYEQLGYNEFISFVEISYSDWLHTNNNLVVDCITAVVDSEQAMATWGIHYNALERISVNNLFLEKLKKHYTKAENNPLEVSSNVDTAIGDLTQTFSGLNISNTVKTLESNIQIYQEEFKKKLDPGYNPLLFGLYEFDELVEGFDPHTYNIIAARSSVGKSALALTAARNQVMLQKKKVAVFNLEMNNIDFIHRWVSQDLYIDSRLLRRPKFLTQEERKRVVEQTKFVTENYQDSLFLIDDIYDVDKIKEHILTLYKTYGIDAVYIDLIGCVTTRERFASEQQRLAYISNEFFEFRKRIPVSFFMIQQQNKSGDSFERESEQMTLRGGEDTYIQSDITITLYRRFDDTSGKEIPTQRIIKIAKNRHGELGAIPVGYKPEFTLFKDLGVTVNLSQ